MNTHILDPDDSIHLPVLVSEVSSLTHYGDHFIEIYVELLQRFKSLLNCRRFLINWLPVRLVNLSQTANQVLLRIQERELALISQFVPC